MIFSSPYATLYMPQAPPPPHLDAVSFRQAVLHCHSMGSLIRDSMSPRQWQVSPLYRAAKLLWPENDKAHVQSDLIYNNNRIVHSFSFSKTCCPKHSVTTSPPPTTTSMEGLSADTPPQTYPHILTITDPALLMM